MGRHIFLTGEKRVGKSTLVKAVLSRTSLRYGGLKSISVFDDKGDRNVYVLPVSSDVPNPDMKAGVCSSRHIVERHPEVFDGYGRSLLSTDGVDLIVIDEIGNMEKDASLYSGRVLELLDQSDVIVLGVLQKMAQSPLAEAIRNHGNVEMVEVTEENRESLVSYVLGKLHPSFSPSTKLILQRGVNFALGPGICSLLEEIERTGSVASAASNLSVSYSKAWKMIREAEEGFSKRLVERSSGGARGGEAKVTEYGMKAVAAFRNAEVRIREYSQKVVAEEFSNL